METPKDINKFILAWIVIIGFIGITVYLLHLVHSGQQISDTTGSVFMLLGAISGFAGMVMQYFFGSTQSSADKTKAMVELAKQAPPPEVKDGISTEVPPRP